MFSAIERETVLRAKFTQLQGSLRGIGTDAGIERIAETGRGLTNPAGAAKIGELFPPGCGPVAQLGARFHGMEEVIGSIPIRSTNQFNHLNAPPVRDFVASVSQIPKRHHAPVSLRPSLQVLRLHGECSENSPALLRQQVSPCSSEDFLTPLESRPLQVHPHRLY